MTARCPWRCPCSLCEHERLFGHPPIRPDTLIAPPGLEHSVREMLTGNHCADALARLRKAQQMEKTMPADDKDMRKCVCGERFPVHLADVGLTSHVCSCCRAYKIDARGRFVPNGTEPNPFAALGK